MNCHKQINLNWIDVKERLPSVSCGKFKVRLNNGSEISAYFYQDSIGWIAFYGQKTSHWWQACYPHARLDDVTHWLETS